MNLQKRKKKKQKHFYMCTDKTTKLFNLLLLFF